MRNLLAILSSIRDSFYSEIHHWVLWLIVVFASGTMFYFALDKEPAFSLWLVVAISSLVMILLFRKQHMMRWYFLGLLCFSVAIVNASFRTSSLASTKLDVSLEKVRLRGVIERDYNLESGKRLLIRITDIKDFDGSVFHMPKTAQVTVRTNFSDLKVGQYISLYANLYPTSTSVFPNKYDFGRHAYFNRVDANGFAVSKVKILRDTEKKTLHEKLENMRSTIYKILTSSLGDKHGKIAAALTIGEQSSVDQNILESMRKSGLSHVLSVSGVHLSLVSIICFFVVRFLLSNFTFFAQHFNVKKIAAIISFFCTLFYLLISGMQVATVRSFIMVAFIIVAVLLDREDDSKRSLCFAALLILIFMPESIFHPSFQMSFSAVLGLVASYEFYIKNIASRLSKDRGVISKIKLYLYGSIFSSLIAGLSTAMFVIYHFNNYSHYSVVANLLSAPIVSFFIMPGVVLTFLLMPLGLHMVGLFVMDIGIKLMLKISDYVASLPGSMSFLPTIPTYILLIFLFGFLWLTLWERKWRLLGLAPIAISLALLTTLRFPTLIVDSKYKTVLMKDNNSLMKIGGPSRYSDWYSNQWLSLTATDEIKKIKIDQDYYSFSKNDCSVKIQFDTQKKYAKKIDLIEIRNNHDKIKINAQDLAYNGSYFIYLDGKNIRYECSVDHDSKRPWSYGKSEF